ncbi:MAG TPA: ABC transporter permease [Bacteroidales bacterium]|nr:ABC transporter permease [Bacteroidales bacterium]
MNPLKFIVRSLFFYRKQHAGLFLGMVVSAAVLTGALIIGDSIQFSLERMVDKRLGKTSYAVIGGSRFMESKLALNLNNDLQCPVSPMLMLKGIALNPENDARVNQAMILGIDGSFNSISSMPLPGLTGDEALVNTNTANRLNLKVGDDLIIRVQSASMIPVNAPFSREPAPSVAIRLTVKSIISDDQAGGFNLSNSQSAVFNVFTSVDVLGDKMNLPGLANILLISQGRNPINNKVISESINRVWTLKDMGLSLKLRNKGQDYDVVSDRIFIDTIVQYTVKKAGIPNEEILTYLINDIASHGNHTPYSFASAVSSAISGSKLNENEVLVNRWTADDLGVLKGDSVRLTWYQIGPRRTLHETTQQFLIKEIVENDNGADSTLMPKFPGLSEAGNCSDWDAGVPIDMERIRDKDEKYWDDYRGTPKVILSSLQGLKMWRNSFGSATALRFREAYVPATRLTSLLLSSIKPSDLGIQIVQVRKESMNATENSVNFTELFLGMSFIVIAAGLLLSVLLFSLHFDRRSAETALLSALGYSQKRITGMRMVEASFVILSGSTVGALVGIFYNKALIEAINTIWQDMVRMNVLTVHVKGSTLILGILTSTLFAVVPVAFVTMRKLKQSLVTSLKGIAPDYPHLRRKKNNRNLPAMSVTQLAISNVKRNKSRSLAVIILLALGTFTIVLTGAYRKTFYGTEQIRKSGTGGYLLWAETMSPVLFDLNDSTGKERLITENPDDLEGIKFLQFEKLSGDNASCLNLNQAQHPAILGINPSAFDSVGAFSFSHSPYGNKEHPWLELERYLNDSTFPAFADQTVLQYSLKRKTGDTLFYISESGKKIGLVLAGSVNNSIFQGHILISDRVFRKLFPSSGGTQVMMADGPLSKQESLAGILSQSLADYGIDIIPASQRLAEFNSVENTYLSVFMALSGLGFIIGTIGLGIVLLRNVHERRRELALMMALGYGRRLIFRMVFIENLFLLVTGWGTGLVAAFLAILPSLLSPLFDLQGGYIAVLTLGIFISGVIWIYFPLKSTLKKPLIQALRNE